MKTHNFLLSLMLITTQTAAVFACNCDGAAELKESIDHSQIVFKGTVISKTSAVNLAPYGIVTTGDLSNKKGFDYQWTQTPTAVITIKIDKIYKGKSVSKTITILTPITGASCGFRFEIGRTYTIFATTNENALTTIERKSTNDTTYFTNDCSATHDWYKSDEKDITALMR
jgi:hypothetical protein